MKGNQIWLKEEILSWLKKCAFCGSKNVHFVGQVEFFTFSSLQTRKTASLLHADLFRSWSDLFRSWFYFVQILFRFDQILFRFDRKFSRFCSDLFRSWSNLNKSEQIRSNLNKIWPKSDQTSDQIWFEQIWTNLNESDQDLKKYEQSWTNLICRFANSSSPYS